MLASSTSPMPPTWWPVTGTKPSSMRSSSSPLRCCAQVRGDVVDGSVVSRTDATQPSSRPPGRPVGGSVAGRDRLLAAALELFPRSGYATTTVEELVSTAGVTQPVLYHHFGTKAGLYVAAAEHVYRIVLDRHEAVLQGDPSFAEAI